MTDNSFVKEVTNVCNHSDTEGLLCITVDSVAMTTTCIGSQKGVEFLNHNVQKLDVFAETTIKSLLVQFLSEQYGAEFPVREQLIPNNNMRRSRNSIKAVYKNQTSDVSKNDVNQNDSKLLSRSGRKIKVPKRFDGANMQTCTRSAENQIKTIHENVEANKKSPRQLNLGRNCASEVMVETNMTKKNLDCETSEGMGKFQQDEKEVGSPCKEKNIPGDNQLTCNICNATFASKRNLKRHFKQKHGEHVIEKHEQICIEDSNNTLDDKGSDIDKREKSKEVGIDNRQNNIYVDIEKSRYVDTNNREKSKDVDIDREKSRDVDIDNREKSRKTMTVKQLPVEDVSKPGLDKHVETINEENRQEDEKMIRTDQTQEIKLKKIINCKYCDEKFISRFKLKRHIKSAHEDDVQNITPGIFTCSTCHKIFTSYIERFYHEKDDHDQVPTADDNINPGSNKDKKYKCPVCYKCVKTKESWKTHMNDHFNTDIKELTCDICNSVMRTKQKLKLHKETHGVAKYACNICGKLFRLKHYINAHRIVHQSESGGNQATVKNPPHQQKNVVVKERIPGLCDICGRVFKMKSMAAKHRTVHLGNASKKYSCPICSKRFRLHKTLREHMYTHSEDKNFICELCGLAFKSDTNLKMHHKIHHENREYNCQYCKRKFRSSDGRKYHYLKEHRDQVKNLGFKLYPCTHCEHVSHSHQTSIRHLSSHVDNKVLACPICQARYATVSDLNKHKKTHFNENRHFRCKICNFSFLQRNKLKTHLFRHKHRENCQAAGFNLDSVITDINNKDIVEISESRVKQYKWFDKKNRMHSNRTNTDVEEEAAETDSQYIHDVQYEVEEECVEEVTDYSLDDGDQQTVKVFKLEDLRANNLIIETEHGFFLDSSNEAVQSILKL